MSAARTRLTDGSSYDLSGLADDITGRFLATGGPQLAAAALAAGELPEIPGAAELRVGAPIARPGVVVCVGLNYAAHAAESNVTPPEHPVIFLMPLAGDAGRGRPDGPGAP